MARSGCRTSGPSGRPSTLMARFRSKGVSLAFLFMFTRFQNPVAAWKPQSTRKESDGQPMESSQIALCPSRCHRDDNGRTGADVVTSSGKLCSFSTVRPASTSCCVSLLYSHPIRAALLQLIMRTIETSGTISIGPIEKVTIRTTSSYSQVPSLQLPYYWN